MIFGILAVVMAASLGISYYEIRRSAELSAGDRLESLSSAITSVFQDQFSQRLSAMHRIAADTNVAAALATPSRPLRPVVIRALAMLKSQADSLTPPMLLTLDGRPVGDDRLEGSDDLSHVIDDFRQGVMSDTGYVGRIYTAAGHSSYW